MNIVKASEPMTVEHPIFHIIGDPGLGKSTLIGTADRPLLLDFDLGAHRAPNRPDTVPVRTWADVADLTEQKGALDDYATIGVDTVGRCLDVMSVEIIRTNPKLGRGGALSQQGWGELKTRFRSWLSSLRALGKDVVLVSHAKEDKDGDTRIVRADIAGSSYAEVMRVAEFVGYLTMSGRDRVLDFTPSDRSVGKNPAGWDAFQVPHYAKEADFLARLMRDGRAAFVKMNTANAAAMSALADWTAKLEECTDAEEINALTPAIEKVTPAVVQAQVKVLRSQRAKVLGLVADVKAKKYVAAKEPAQATA